MRHSSERSSGKIFLELPVAIRRTSSKSPAEIAFQEGDVVAAGCLSCKDPRCISYATDDSNLKRLTDFASNPNVDVCPTSALNFKPGAMVPSVEDELCVSCGLCLVRCPVGAIYNDRDTILVAPPDGFVEEKVREVALESISSDTFNQSLTDIQTTEAISFSVKDSHALTVVNAAKKLPQMTQNSFVQSILTAMGAKVNLSRKGDVHTRLDGVYEIDNEIIGPIEIESGADSLEAARAILDDISVLHNRYGIPINKQTPLVVFFELPTRRQGYWQLVADIRDTLGIQVRTVSLGALLLMLWTGQMLDKSSLDKLVPAFGAISIRSAVEEAISRKVSLDIGQGGILEPLK